MVTAYLLAQTVVTPLYGKLGDVMVGAQAALGDVVSPRQRPAGGRPHRHRAGHDARRDRPRLGVARVGLAVAGVASPVAFFLVERRAAEPILPPRPWRSATFRITGAVGLIIGFALFGAVTFLPLFQQVVRGESPTASGLQLLPLMAGVMVSSIASGRMIAATGHHRLYPILGTGLTVVGMLLLSTMGPGTGAATAAAFMALLGCGLGMVMQVLILAVQNDAPYEDLGVATAGATLFRSIGGSSAPRCSARCSRTGRWWSSATACRRARLRTTVRGAPQERPAAAAGGGDPVPG